MISPYAKLLNVKSWIHSSISLFPYHHPIPLNNYILSISLSIFTTISLVKAFVISWVEYNSIRFSHPWSWHLPIYPPYRHHNDHSKTLIRLWHSPTISLVILVAFTVNPTSLCMVYNVVMPIFLSSTSRVGWS